MLEIEIIQTDIIDGGIQVFVRAWRDGNQIGFGKDGTVDIERFRVFNPPVLVPDPDGDIVSIIEATYADGVLRTPEEKHFYREDPEEALLQVIEQAVSTQGKEGSNIIAGSIGNTVSTFYPDANVETSTFDSYYESDSTSRTWAATIALTTATGGDSSTQLFLMGYRKLTGNNFRFLDRGIALFDTSPIGTDVVSSATLSLYGVSKANATGNIGGSTITGVTTASNTGGTASDFNNFGSTQFTTAKTYADFSLVAYNDYVLNASGIANIINGISKFGFIGEDDINGTTPTASTGIFDDYVRAHSAENASGTTQAPKLVVTHAAAGSASASPSPSPSASVSASPSPSPSASVSSSPSSSASASASSSPSPSVSSSPSPSVSSSPSPSPSPSPSSSPSEGASPSSSPSPSVSSSPSPSVSSSPSPSPSSSVSSSPSPSPSSSVSASVSSSPSPSVSASVSSSPSPSVSSSPSPSPSSSVSSSPSSSVSPSPSSSPSPSVSSSPSPSVSSSPSPSPSSSVSASPSASLSPSASPSAQDWTPVAQASAPTWVPVNKNSL